MLSGACLQLLNMQIQTGHNYVCLSVCPSVCLLLPTSIFLGLLVSTKYLEASCCIHKMWAPTLQLYSMLRFTNISNDGNKSTSNKGNWNIFPMLEWQKRISNQTNILDEYLIDKFSRDKKAKNSISAYVYWSYSISFSHSS